MRSDIARTGWVFLCAEVANSLEELESSRHMRIVRALSKKTDPSPK